ncbi:hypothetical protein GALL_237980 [mine drainage metagenome]|uniref:Uncharacterized protein n=1 Tax=mine drainage metagenome TaxID=410659 RepID=A0A1J5RDV4_9ZZZZ
MAGESGEGKMLVMLSTNNNKNKVIGGLPISIDQETIPCLRAR